MRNSKIKLYSKLYKKTDDYLRNLQPMYRVINASINFECNSFLDYGCGRSNLSECFKEINNMIVFKYDPAIELYSHMPKDLKVDLIANCDVMEHIPEKEIDNIIKEMSTISNNVFFNIYLTEAKTFLENGENAHCTIKPIAWWVKKINKFYPSNTIIQNTYKNSVTIITWQISNKEKIKIILVNMYNIYEHILWNFKEIIKKLIK